MAARNGRRQRNSQSVDGQGQLLGKTLHDVPLSRRSVPHILQPYVHRQTQAERRFRRSYVSMYVDIPNAPLFPYGYGLSYSQFEIGKVRLSSDKLERGGKITASVSVANTSKTDGYATIQLYIHDLFASRVRPVKELKAYKKVYIKAGESIDVCMDIDENMLKFWDENMKYLAENGEFDVYVGEDSSTENSARFTLA